MSKDLIRFVSARQWRKAVKELEENVPLGDHKPKDLGVRLGFNAEVETLKGSTPKPEGRQLLLAISSETVDRDTDSIAVDGWKLEQYRKNPVVLFGHHYWNNEAPVVGRSLAEFVDKGKLKSLMEFTPQGMVPLADTLYGLYSEGFMNAASVGFIPLKWQFPEDDEARAWGVDFLEQELLEYSLVPVPSNPDALVEARSKGIETEPLKVWAEQVLDAWGKNKQSNLWIAKTPLKALRDAADPKQARSAQVPAGIESKPEGPGDPPESGKTGIQTMLFVKDLWDKDAAKVWLDEHDLYSSVYDETDEHHRFRQFEPEACESGSFVTLTESFPDGVSAVSCTAKAAAAVVTDGAKQVAAAETDGEPDGSPDVGSAGSRVVEFAEESLRFKDGAADSELAALIASTDWTITRVGDVVHMESRSAGSEGITAPAPEKAAVPEPEPVVIGDGVTLTDAQLELLKGIGLDLETMKLGGEGGGEGFVIVDSDDDGSDERSLSDLREVLAEVIGEDVEAAITHAINGGNRNA